MKEEIWRGKLGKGLKGGKLGYHVVGGGIVVLYICNVMLSC